MRARVVAPPACACALPAVLVVSLLVLVLTASLRLIVHRDESSRRGGRRMDGSAASDDGAHRGGQLLEEARHGGWVDGRGTGRATGDDEAANGERCGNQSGSPER